MDQQSVTSISDSSAVAHLRDYTKAENTFAWPLYDKDGSPDELTGADLTAPALLSYPVDSKYLNQMGADGSQYFELVDRMRSVVAADRQVLAEVDEQRIANFVTRPRDGDSGTDAIGTLMAAIDQVQRCKGLTSVFVTKVLHRKRPDLVPINDSRVRSFYGTGNDFAPLLAAVHHDVKYNHEWLSQCAQEAKVSEMSLLRVLDIIIWMHCG